MTSERRHLVVEVQSESLSPHSFRRYELDAAPKG